MHDDDMKNAAMQERILSSLSPALHSLVIWKINERWLTSIWFLRADGVEQEVMIALAHHLKARVFPPEEICPHGMLYIVKKGLAMCSGKIIRDGGCWGEDVVLHALARQHHFAIAINYLWVYTLDARAILKCLKQYPESARVISRLIARWTISVFVLEAARKVKSNESHAESSAKGLACHGDANNVDGKRSRPAQARVKFCADLTQVAPGDEHQTCNMLQLEADQQSCMEAPQDQCFLKSNSRTVGQRSVLEEKTVDRKNKQQRSQRRGTLAAAQSFAAIAAVQESDEQVAMHRMDAMHELLIKLMKTQGEVMSHLVRLGSDARMNPAPASPGAQKVGRLEA